LSLTKQGIIPRNLENPEGKFPANFDSYQVVLPGDLVFCLFDIDETPRTVGLSSLGGMITGAYNRFECLNPSEGQFVYFYYLAMDNGKSLKPLYSGLRKVIQQSTFMSAKMPLPPGTEQTAIVRYLDHADRKVRYAIRARQQLIKLLTEQKQAIIQRAVTRGLDPSVRLKPSGVPWLGDVPEQWSV
jgi:type I restriction enzyme S subunit